MCTTKIPRKEFDVLHKYILESKDQEAEVLVDGRHGGRPISVCLAGSCGLSSLAATALAEAVKRHFEGQSERVRLRTQFFLQAYHDIPMIYLGYRMGDHILELERATYEVPEQIMRLIDFLKDGGRVELRIGHTITDPYYMAQFSLYRTVSLAGKSAPVHATQSAFDCVDFFKRELGDAIARIVKDGVSKPEPYYTIELKIQDYGGEECLRFYYSDYPIYTLQLNKIHQNNQEEKS